MPLNMLSVIDKDKMNFNNITPPLMLEARTDGTGARLTSLLHAMYAAENYNCRFGFVWHKRDDKFNEYIKNKENSLSGVIVEDEYKIFNKDFIKNHSYTGIIKNSNNCQRKDLEKGILSEIWGWYICRPSQSQLKSDKPYKDYPLLWHKIGFSEEIEEVFSQVEKDIINLGEYSAIHYRSGDILFNDIVRTGGLFSHFFKQKRVIPIEILVHFINNMIVSNKIVLLGDDFNLIRYIKNCCNRKVLSIDDFTSKKYLLEDSYKKVYYDLWVMAKAKEVYSNFSSFAELATMISRGDITKKILSHYSLDDQYNIILENLHKYDVSLHYKVYSSLYLFFIGMELNKNINILEKHIDFVCQNDNTNSQFHLIKIFVFIKQNNFSAADAYIHKKIVEFKTLEKFMSNYRVHANSNGFTTLLFSSIKSVNIKYINLIKLLDFLIQKSGNTNYIYQKDYSKNTMNLQSTNLTKYKKEIKMLINPFAFFKDSKNFVLRCFKYFFIKTNGCYISKKDATILCKIVLSSKKNKVFVYITLFILSILFLKKNDEN